MPERCRVVVVEDNPDLAGLLDLVVNCDVRLDVRYVTSNFADLLTPEPWVDVDAAIIDIMLAGGPDGREILHYLAQNHPYIRRVAWTALDKDLVGDDTDEQVLLAKPSTLEQIVEAVTHA